MEIGWQAFAECGNLADVYCLAENVPETAIIAFEHSPLERATLHVPEGSVDVYKAQGPWKQFGKVEPIRGSGIERLMAPAKGALCYLLDGCRSSKPQKGIYIQNGRKFVTTFK